MSAARPATAIVIHATRINTPKVRVERTLLSAGVGTDGCDHVHRDADNYNDEDCRKDEEYCDDRDKISHRRRPRVVQEQRRRTEATTGPINAPNRPGGQ